MRIRIRVYVGLLRILKNVSTAGATHMTCSMPAIRTLGVLVQVQETSVLMVLLVVVVVVGITVAAVAALLQLELLWW